MLAWVWQTQPKAWNLLLKNHGSETAATLSARLRDQLNQRAGCAAPTLQAGSDTSDQDQLRDVNSTILGKVAESKKLQVQACDNTREQFACSPTSSINAVTTLRNCSALKLASDSGATTMHASVPALMPGRYWQMS